MKSSTRIWIHKYNNNAAQVQTIPTDDRATMKERLSLARFARNHLNEFFFVVHHFKQQTHQFWCKIHVCNEIATYLFSQIHIHSTSDRFGWQNAPFCMYFVLKCFFSVSNIALFSLYSSSFFYYKDCKRMKCTPNEEKKKLWSIFHSIKWRQFLFFLFFLDAKKANKNFDYQVKAISLTRR